jgi:signal transduction histidine kinase
MRLPPNVELNLYRILQESLNNIMKHAHAQRVDVLVHRRTGEISLVIEDDGVGFEQGNGSRAASVDWALPECANGPHC